jgi:ATP-binding cassette subfamily B protein
MRRGGLDPPQHGLRESLIRLRTILNYFSPYSDRMALVVGAMLLSTFLGLLQPQLMRLVLDVALPQRDLRLLSLLVLGTLALPLAQGGIGFVQGYVSTWVSQQVSFDARDRLYRHVQTFSLRFFASTKTGDILSRINRDAGQISQAISGTLLPLVSQVLTLSGILVAVMLMNWRLGLLALSLLPPFFFSARYFGGIMRRLYRQHGEAWSELTAVLQQGLAGIRLVQALQREEEEAKRYAAQGRETIRLAMRIQAYAGRQSLINAFLSALGPALVLWYGGAQVINGSLTIGELLAFTNYIARLFGPVSAFANMNVQLQQALAAFDRVQEYLELQTEIRDRPGAIELPPLRGRIEFQDVSFAYSPERPILKHISFTVEPGQLVALVGPTGAGKSTIVNLIPRFYDPDEGCVRIDGYDLRDVTLSSLRRQIATVDQETFLFNTTILENIRYARPEATFDEVVEAAKAAYLHDFIMSLPEGYETVVGERGVKLSGGERQRLAIARAILRNPRILILDEATSSLDSIAESSIQRALEPLMRGRTVIAIAHRLSTILSADKILVLQQGELVESGTHRELLARGGLYAQLYRTQFKEELRAAPLTAASRTF